MLNSYDKNSFSRFPEGEIGTEITIKTVLSLAHVTQECN